MPQYAATSVASGTSSASVAEPSGCVTGSFLLCFKVDRATSGTTTAPTGWTRVASAAGASGRIEAFVGLYGRNSMSAGPWSFAGTTRTLARIERWTGVEPADIGGNGYGMDVVPVVRYNASGTTGTGGITPTTNGCALVAGFGALTANYTWSAEALANGPTLGNEQESAYSTYLDLAICNGVQATAGATGNQTGTMSTGAANACGIVAIRPASLSAVAGITPTATLVAQRPGTYRAVAGGMTPAGALSKRAAKLLAGGFSAAGTPEGIILDATTEWLYRTTNLLSPSSASYTVMAWIKIGALDSDTTWHPIFGLVNASDGDEFAARYGSSSTTMQWEVWIAGSAGYEGYHVETESRPMAWHHVAFVVTKSGTTYSVQLYVDGTLAALSGSSSGTESSRFTPTKMMIGASLDVASPADTWTPTDTCEIACVKAWQAALTSGEVSAEINYLLPQKSGCVLCVTGIDGHDYSGTGDFTKAGNPTQGSGPTGVTWAGGGSGLVGTLVALAKKALAAAMTPGATLSGQKTGGGQTWSGAGGLTPAGSVATAKAAAVNLAGSITSMAGALVKRVGRLFRGDL